MNCALLPAGRELLAGDTVIDTNAAGVTVSVAVPLMVPEVAVTTVLPAARVVASPAVVMVATDWVLELQAAEAVRSCVVPSLYVPLAAYWTVAPAATDAPGGVTAIDTSEAFPCV